jgi:glycine/D-amino acid oxidase-like deaminating enzyme
MGFRPSLPDSLPVIGPSTATSDIVYASAIAILD